MIGFTSLANVSRLLKEAPAFTPYGVALLRQQQSATHIPADDFVIATTEAVKEHKAIRAIVGDIRKLSSIPMSTAALDEL